MATSPRRAAPVAQFVSFLRLQDYSAGGVIPDGDYLLVDFSVVNFTPTKKDGTVAGPMRLSVRVTFDPPNGAQTQEERKDNHYSMGGKAHLSYQPDPTTGKRLIPVEGGPAAGFYETSNWHIFLKSLYDCGMPEDFAVDDLSALDGIKVHIKGIKEPESRKELRSQNTGEVQAEAKEPMKIPVVNEIISAPWMEAARPAPVPIARPVAAPVALPAPVAAPAGRAPLAMRPPVAAAPAPVAVAQPATAESNEQAVADAILKILEANPTGCTQLALQTGVFRELASNPNRPEIMNAYFADEAVLGSILNQMGFQLAGKKVSAL